MPVTSTVLFGMPQQEIASLIESRMAQASSVSVVTGFATPGGLAAISGPIEGQPQKLRTLVVGAATYPGFAALDNLLSIGVPADRLYVNLGHTSETGGQKNPFARYHPMLHSKVYYMELTDADLDAQMDEINKEETALEVQIAELGGRIAGADSIGSTIRSAQTLLAELRKRLDQPVSWEQKRRLMEVLVAGVQVDTAEESGVKQTRATVTYRFSQPDQAMPLVLPQSYSTGQVIRIPLAPETVGDHIRRKRLALKMLQKDVAQQLGVDKTSVFNWEANTSKPEIRYMPAIIRFLGYNPLPEANTVAEQLIRRRTSLGILQKDAAGRLGVDPGTLAKWEQGKRDPAGVFLTRVQNFLQEGKVSDARLAG
jgi:transcriptional regulator with XRE-family HTH domain